MNSPHKGPVTRKMFPFDDVIMNQRPFIPQVPERGGYVYDSKKPSCLQPSRLMGSDGVGLMYSLHQTQNSKEAF